MVTLKEKSSITAGSCMFCNKVSLFVNVLYGNNIEVRICDLCLIEVNLIKRTTSEIGKKTKTGEMK